MQYVTRFGLHDLIEVLHRACIPSTQATTGANCKQVKGGSQFNDLSPMVSVSEMCTAPKSVFPVWRTKTTYLWTKNGNKTVALLEMRNA